MQNDIHSQEDGGAHDQVKRCPASLRGLEGRSGQLAGDWWGQGQHFHCHCSLGKGLEKQKKQEHVEKCPL